MWGHASCHKNYILLQIIFFSNKVTSNLGVFNIFKANKMNIKFTLQKRNFKVLVFKSKRSLWGHASCHILGHPVLQNDESKKFWHFFLFLFSLCRCPSLRCYGHFCTHRWLFHLSWFQSMVRWNGTEISNLQ